MNSEEIKLAVKEAKRFIKLAELTLSKTSETYKSGSYEFNVRAPKESAATRRASMDLTRQLAQMRNK